MHLATIDLLDLAVPVTIRHGERATDDQVQRLAEEHRPCKVERNRSGEITTLTPVGGIGSTHELFVASALFHWAEADGRGVAFGSNAGFNLPDNSLLSPDAAWLSLPRWDAPSAEQQAGFPPLCPEFVVEIRSRTDALRTLEEKVDRWLENGAAQVWLLDPIEGHVGVYPAGACPEDATPCDAMGNWVHAGF